MRNSHKGLTIAREILLIVTFCTTIANVVLMIVQMCLESKEARGYYEIKGNDELPF